MRLIRVEKGLKLEDVAISADFDAGNLSRIERGQQGYSDETLSRLAEALEIRLSELFTKAEEITEAASRRSKARQPQPLAKPHLDPETSRLAEAIQSLPPDARNHLQAVTDSFVKSQAIEDWNGVERRRKTGGKK